jgi:hypothetical protein
MKEPVDGTLRSASGAFLQVEPQILEFLNTRRTFHQRSDSKK